MTRKGILAGASALALATCVTQSAAAQGVNQVVPLSPTCQPQSARNFTQCTTTVIGSFTSTPAHPPIVDGNHIVTDQHVSFDGTLQIEGSRLQADPFAASALVTSDIFQNTTVDLAAEYDTHGDLRNVEGYLIPTDQSSATFQSVDVRAINIGITDGEYTNGDGEDDDGGTFTLAAVDPAAVVDNAVQLTGTFKTDSDNSGPLQFGTLTGTATLLTGNNVSVLGGPGFEHSYVSAFALDVRVAQTVTTQLDETGLITPKIAVTDGIDMNGSRITNLGAGVADGDAVNVGQLRAAVALTGETVDSIQIGNSTATGGKSVAIGFENVATGDGAVAIGDPNIATGTGAVAIGADNTATGTGAVAIGNLSTANGTSAVALGSQANAATVNSIAVGQVAQATGLAAIAIGNNSTATGTDAVAIGGDDAGSGANANGNSTTAVGGESDAVGPGATAYGWRSNAGAERATALGHLSQATGVRATAVGEAAVASGLTSTAVGNQSAATDEDAVAVGDLATASGFHSTAVGGEAVASGRGAQAFGWQSSATGALSLASGHQANAAGSQASAVGKSANASGANASAFGTFTDAAAANSVAIGNGATTRSANAASLGTSVAVGNLAVAADEDAVAIGDQAQAAGFHSTAVGGEAVASARGAQAFGWQSRATGNLSLAVGHQANAGGVNATAIGKNANAGYDNSTAVGFGAATTRANQVVIGGAGSSVTVGDIAASTAAQTGATALVTVDASGTLGRDTTSLGTINSSIAALQATNVTQAGQITTLQNQTATLFDLNDRNRRDIRKANEGVAMALAMDTPSIPQGANFALSGGVGYYQNRTSFAAAISAAIGPMSQVSAGVGAGIDSGEVGARAGFQFAW